MDPAWEEDEARRGTRLDRETPTFETGRLWIIRWRSTARTGTRRQHTGTGRRLHRAEQGGMVARRKAQRASLLDLPCPIHRRRTVRKARKALLTVQSVPYILRTSYLDTAKFETWPSCIFDISTLLCVCVLPACAYVHTVTLSPPNHLSGRSTCPNPVEYPNLLPPPLTGSRDLALPKP